jgi:hypothetical protein
MIKNKNFSPLNLIHINTFIHHLKDLGGESSLVLLPSYFIMAEAHIGIKNLK